MLTTGLRLAMPVIALLLLLDVALALLGRMQQQLQLLSLAFFRGCTHEEIAAQTGIALGTVKSQIRRTLTALRAQLAPYAI